MVFFLQIFFVKILRYTLKALYYCRSTYHHAWYIRSSRHDKRNIRLNLSNKVGTRLLFCGVRKHNVTQDGQNTDQCDTLQVTLYKKVKMSQVRFDWACSWDIMNGATSLTPLANRPNDGDSSLQTSNILHYQSFIFLRIITIWTVSQRLLKNIAHYTFIKISAFCNRGSSSIFACA